MFQEVLFFNLFCFCCCWFSTFSLPWQHTFTIFQGIHSHFITPIFEGTYKRPLLREKNNVRCCIFGYHIWSIVNFCPLFVNFGPQFETRCTGIFDPTVQAFAVKRKI